MALLYIIVGVVAGVIGANMAKDRGQNPALWFVICFLVPIAIIGLLFIENKNKKESHETNEDSVETFQDDTYSFSLQKTDSVTFESIKTLVKEFYKEYGLDDIKLDNNNIFVVKTQDAKAYIQVENKPEKVNLSVKNSVRPDFVDSLYPERKEEPAVKIQPKTYDTEKLINLGNMLDKGLITKEEFENMKQELIKA